jgi:hypothetical protein
MDEYCLAMQVRAGEVFGVDCASIGGRDQNSRQVGQLVESNICEVGSVGITGGI